MAVAIIIRPTWSVRCGLLDQMQNPVGLSLVAIILLFTVSYLLIKVRLIGRYRGRRRKDEKKLAVLFISVVFFLVYPTTLFLFNSVGLSR